MALSASLRAPLSLYFYVTYLSPLFSLLLLHSYSDFYYLILILGLLSVKLRKAGPFYMNGPFGCQ